MTIVAFHYTETGFFAVADGLISRTDPQQQERIKRVIDKAEKIVAFVPCYRYPRVGLGNFLGFGEVKGKTYYICYAGNFTICRSIIDKFTENATQKLVLRRDCNGKGKILLCENGGDDLRGQRYADDYNFCQSEIVPLPISILIDVLKRVMNEVCQSFCENAMEQPDVELILFGQEEIATHAFNRAEMLVCKSGSHETAKILQSSIPTWTLAFLGDKALITTVQAEILADPVFSPSALVTARNEDNGWNGITDTLSELKQARDKVLQKHILPLAYNNKGTAGGDCIIAQSEPLGTIRLRKIRNENIPAELEG
jgi:hypothetical protein